MLDGLLWPLACKLHAAPGQATTVGRRDLQQPLLCVLELLTQRFTGVTWSGDCMQQHSSRLSSGLVYLLMEVHAASEPVSWLSLWSRVQAAFQV